jgi:hypothetical protein
MRLTHRQLSLRDKGYGTFEFVANIEYSPGETMVHLIEEYNKIRSWCWETFGPSCERDHHITLYRHGVEVNPHWAWSVETSTKSIYFVSDTGLNWMLLKFSDMDNA